ncbi:hypothetical protein J4466_03550 [Candidatus Pacearchaeota archaeon]|nr:hypothetical protein [Candidatus Pacearchaeota archaeon]
MISQSDLDHLRGYVNVAHHCYIGNLTTFDSPFSVYITKKDPRDREDCMQEAEFDDVIDMARRAGCSVSFQSIPEKLYKGVGLVDTQVTIIPKEGVSRWEAA